MELLYLSLILILKWILVLLRIAKLFNLKLMVELYISMTI